MSFSEETLSTSFEGSNPYKRITRRIDSVKIRNNQKKDIDVNTVNTDELCMLRDNPIRAGAIIYTKKNGITYFCLGVDTESGNLTDFGGGVKKDESVIDGSLRELAEESLGVFGVIELENLKKSLTFHTYNMAIVFIPLDISPREISQNFNEKISEKENPEVCDIVWLSTEEFLESVHGRGMKLYIRVRKLLAKVTAEISKL